MVPGLSVFRDWFDNYHGRHVIIGGTACNLVYAQYGAPERATKDIDLVVLAEAFDRSYFDRFVAFVHAGGYEHRTKDGRYQLKNGRYQLFYCPKSVAPRSKSVV